jgi:hypothetical protein
MQRIRACPRGAAASQGGPTGAGGGDRGRDMGQRYQKGAEQGVKRRRPTDKWVRPNLNLSFISNSSKF